MRPGFEDDPYLSSVAKRAPAEYWKEIRQALRSLSPRMRFLFACVFAVLWVFPSILTEKRIWSNAEHRWVTFEEDYQRRFFMMVDYGERPMGI